MIARVFHQPFSEVDSLSLRDYVFFVDQALIFLKQESA